MALGEPSQRSAWVKTNVIKEDHGRPIWCVAFNTEQKQNADLFATVGGNTATVYRASEGGDITPLLTYIDDNTEEEYYVCKWSRDAASGHPLLLIAGKLALVRVIDGTTQQVVHTLVGHGDAINDITVHYRRPHLPITASRDMSLRLWNLRTGVCALVFSGEGGHRNEILSVDFHPSDVSRVVSAGMDYSIKIWGFEEHEAIVAQSETWADAGGTLSFPTRQLHHPLFSSYKLHFNFVDCVRWVGDCILSKSPAAKILLWRPADEPEAARRGYAQVLQEYEFTEGNMWWLRFSTDPECRLLACGNSGRESGSKVFVWDLSRPSSHAAWVIKRPGAGQVPVRQAALASSGRVVLFACDDSTVWRYDLRVRPTGAR